MLFQEEPFVIENNQSMYPTQPFRGFCIDMLNKLQDELGFTYTIHHVADGQFGYQDPKTKRWNGLVGEVIDGVSRLLHCVYPRPLCNTKNADIEPQG